jgi:hypothetical protein
MRHQVIGCIPAGRRAYMRLLIPHLLVVRELFDLIQIWHNTNDPDDSAFLQSTARQLPKTFSVVGPEQVGAKPPTDEISVIGNICPFWRAAADPDALYIRFDDDIIWMAPDAIQNLIDYRLAHPEPFLVFGNIINNAFCSYLHQRFGCIPLSAGLTTPDAHCTVGWQNPLFAETAHRCFLDHLQRGRTDDYLFNRWICPTYQRVCINVIAFFGRDIRPHDPQSMNGDEETWVTCTRPRELKRPNEICGTALFSHFAFHPQRQHLDQTDTLDQYRRFLPAQTKPQQREEPNPAIAGACHV